MSQINFNPNLTSIPGVDKIAPAQGGKPASGASFQDVFKASMEEVNRLQAEADKATSALATGQTDNIAEVMTAVRKADLAFKTLLQIRNKLLDAYNEVRQMRI